MKIKQTLSGVTTIQKAGLHTPPQEKIAIEIGVPTMQKELAFTPWMLVITDSSGV